MKQLQLKQDGEATRGFKFGAGFVIAAAVVAALAKAITNATSGSGGNGDTSMGWRQGGPAKVAGGISGASIELGIGDPITKEQGETLRADVIWDNLTEDFQGNPINWPFRLYTLSAAYEGSVTLPVNVDAPAGTNNISTTLFATIASDATPGEYAPDLVLEAQTSDDQGNPTGEWVVIDSPSITLTVTEAGGPATPSGNITGVNLAQRRNRVLR